MPSPDRTQSVLDLLDNFHGPDPLKKLFWTELSYNHVNRPLSARGWSTSEANALAGDPVLLASGGTEGDFQIIYMRLASHGLPREQERPIVARLLPDHPYSLFVFSNDPQSHWHFLNVKFDDKANNRRLFRRITVEPGEHHRTASECLAKIDLDLIPPDLFGLSPLAIQQHHDKAFDVEPVTRRFFEQYARVFRSVERLISGFADDDRKRLFTQRLFNRLMFLAFVQKKKWLKLNSRTDYLTALWEDYGRGNGIDRAFYHDRLERLFFMGLNNQQERDLMTVNRGGFLSTLIGEVPYLNGGLFEQEEDEKDPAIFAPDECIGAILEELFNRFNFTVTESTPLDVEVAVDPEMLGKVFEELVTGRHETGSYYTPKPVVSFMGREALKGYLQARLPDETQDTIADFVDWHDPSGLRDPEEVLEALRNAKICDPACGSGAYLLGMLHELLDLRACLFATSKRDAASIYDRKLEIIQNNLYGVDIDRFAINIARLRLWLSLAVDYEGDDPPPLPNLRFKIEVGDSLTSPSPTGVPQQAFRDDLIDSYREAKRLYMTAHGGEKAALEQQILELKEEIGVWTHGGNPVSGFDWAVEFAEVFADGGFDICVANPPYVRHELIRDQKPALQKVHPEVYTGAADLYVYFYSRALQLMKPGGMLAFISSNKWFRADYGAKLRKHISDCCSVLSITDFGDLPVFTSATAYPMIFIAKKELLPGYQTIFTQVKSLEPPYPDVAHLVREQGKSLLPEAVSGRDWTLASVSGLQFRKLSVEIIALNQYVQGQVYYGIKTGLNAAFYIGGAKRAELIAEDPKSAEIIEPLALGRNIKRWHIDFQDNWQIVTKIGVKMSSYPAVFSHLKQWQSQLEARYDKGNHWWELRACAYYNAFQKPKIVYPQILSQPSFAYDETGAFTNQKCFIIVGADKYLLGILNSQTIWELIVEGSPGLRGGFAEPRKEFILSLPIPVASDTDRTSISNLVQKCLDAKGKGREEWEQEINERVARLYGFDVAAHA